MSDMMVASCTRLCKLAIEGCDRLLEKAISLIMKSSSVKGADVAKLNALIFKLQDTREDLIRRKAEILVDYKEGDGK